MTNERKQENATNEKTPQRSTFTSQCYKRWEKTEQLKRMFMRKNWERDAKGMLPMSKNTLKMESTDRDEGKQDVDNKTATMSQEIN